MLRNTHYLGDDYYPAIIEPVTFETAETERIRRAEKLGRVYEPNAKNEVVYPTVFRIRESTDEFNIQQSKLDAALNSDNEPIIIINSKGMITHANHPFELATGLSSNEIIGKEYEISLGKQPGLSFPLENARIPENIEMTLHKTNGSKEVYHNLPHHIQKVTFSIYPFIMPVIFYIKSVLCSY